MTWAEGNINGVAGMAGRAEGNHSRLAPLNLLASCSPSDLGDTERANWAAGEYRRFPSWDLERGGSGGRVGGRSPLS